MSRIEIGYRRVEIIAVEALKNVDLRWKDGHESDRTTAKDIKQTTKINAIEQTQNQSHGSE